MSDHVLVGFDDSEQSTGALEHALERFPDGRVTVLHVADPEASREVTDEHESGPGDVRDRTLDRAENLLDEAREVAAERGRRIETEVRSGDPVTEIVDYAAERDVDHVVVGSHGRDGLVQFLVGSVAENVVSRSPVPVTVYRSGDEE